MSKALLALYLSFPFSLSMRCYYLHDGSLPARRIFSSYTLRQARLYVLLYVQADRGLGCCHAINNEGYQCTALDVFRVECRWRQVSSLFRSRNPPENRGQMREGLR
uniref:Secreted protein n=1 Tax=Rhipicephalus appendiculatus TaxID=34631 RepID=A0A131YAW7_RHIAP